jgi:hypothetical protein
MTLSTTLANVDTMVSIARAVAPISLDRFVLVQYPTVLTSDRSGLTPNTEPADTLIKAVVADRTLHLSTKQKGATDGVGSVTKGGSGSSGSPSPSSSPTKSSSTAGDGGVNLPDTVLGQTVQQQTCSVGNKLGTR